MTIQFIANIRVRHNDLAAFEHNISWLSHQIGKNAGWEMQVCSWQSPSPSPNDTEVVHVWDTPCDDAMAARQAFNRILAELDSARVAQTMATMASQRFLFAAKKVYQFKE